MDAREGSAAATHVGAGVARRAAYHARVQAAGAEAEARCATGEALQREASADDVVLVPAAEVVLAEPGANYAASGRAPSLAARIGRKRALAAAQGGLALGDGLPTGGGRAGDAGDRDAGGEGGEAAMAAAATAWAARHGSPSVGGAASTSVTSGVGLRAVLRAADEGGAEARRGDGVPLCSPHGPDLSNQLRKLRRRLAEFLAEEAAESRPVAFMATERGLYPTMRWTIAFGKWLGCTRIVQSKASRWDLDEQVRKAACRARRALPVAGGAC
jgi:hypothetical protein